MSREPQQLDSKGHRIGGRANNRGLTKEEAMKKLRPESWLGDMRVRFIPVKDGDLVALNGTLVPGRRLYGSFDNGLPNIVVGFKPGTGAKAAGWLVVLVNEAARPDSRPVKKRELKPLRAVG